MSDLVDKIRSRLTIAELAQAAGVALSRTGHRGVGCCPFHTEKTGSFNIWEGEERFKCFGCGVGGDVFDFVALWKLGIKKPIGEQFVQTMRVAAELAGLDFDAENGQRVESERTKNMRRVGNILTAYAELAHECWTSESIVRTHAPKPNGAGKPYITLDVIDRWNLGIAPSQEKCKTAGISDDDLRLVGLLRLKTEGDAQREFMLFRDALIIPHMKSGRATYLAARVYKWDARARYINLPTPDRKTGLGGVENPLIFNAEALYDAKARTQGVLLVEGRLDALACSEIGHPAVAYISSPGAKFIAEVNRYSGTQLYYAPDATKDMTGEKRAEAAAAIGPDTRCCTLPEGLDPDECSHDQLAAVKLAAWDTIEEWLRLFSAA